MSTLDKAESSRRNGAKSHGPVSPEGRERSSRNALKTGLYSKRIPVLSTEQQHELDALRESYYQEWLPQDRRQTDMLDKLIDAEWRYLRFSSMENWLVEDMMSKMKDEVAGMFEGEPDLDLRAALAFQRLYKENPTLENFQRERQRLSRIIDRFIRLLTELQDRNPPAAQNTGNEPETLPESTPQSPDTPEPQPESEKPAARSWNSVIPIRTTRTPEPLEVARAVGS